MNDVAEVNELPIGAGQRRRVTKASDGAGGHDDDRPLEEPRSLPPAPPLALATPEPEPEQLSLWEPAKMRRPLQIVVGKTVNWRMRKATGIETTAGLMSDDQADAINEPLSEIFNRFEPMRAIAAKQTEIALGIAIYDYVQATVVQAGRDAQALEDDYRARSRAAAADVEHPPAPPLPFAEPAPAADAVTRTTNAEEDEL